MASKNHSYLRTLDPYLLPEEPTKKSDVILINVNLVSINPPTRRDTFCKLEELLDVIRNLQSREGYAYCDRIYDLLVTRSIVGTKDEMAQLLRIAHRAGRIKEHGDVNGAWVVAGEWLRTTLG
jgi:hypothetical protein